MVMVSESFVCAQTCWDEPVFEVCVTDTAYNKFGEVMRPCWVSSMYQLYAAKWTEHRTCKSCKVLSRCLWREEFPTITKKISLRNIRPTCWKIQYYHPFIAPWTRAQNYTSYKQRISVPINAKHFITNRPSSAVSFHITIDSYSFVVGSDIHREHTAVIPLELVFPLITVFRFRACTKRNMASRLSTDITICNY